MEFIYNNDVTISLGNIKLDGKMIIPATANGIVIFSHGSGSSHLSPRNIMVAEYLQKQNFGTLLFDLLTPVEDQYYNNRFDIELLTARLIGATEWLEKQPFIKRCRLGYFGASTGAASALHAAAYLTRVTAIVSRGGRPDLAMDVMGKIKSPTLLIVGSLDFEVLELNRKAYMQLTCEKKLAVIPGATHLFEERGKMEQVCEEAGLWFSKYLQPAAIER